MPEIQVSVPLARLLKALGEPEDSATRIAGALVDWQDEDNLVQVAGERNAFP